MSGTGITLGRPNQIPRISGQYLLNVLGNSTGVTAQSELWLSPRWLDEDTPIDQIAVEVTSGAANSFIRPTIYSSNSAYRPNVPLVDGGQLDSSSPGIKTAVVAATIPKGLTWWGAVPQGGTPTVRRASAWAGLLPIALTFDTAFSTPFPGQSGVTGALPSPFVRSTAYGTPICIRVRIA